jgi:hypothetical protein
VTNGSFNSTIIDWTTIYSVGTGSASWAPPGTAQVTSTQFRSGYQLHQCVTVQPNRLYEAGTKAFIPAGQAPGNAVFAVFLVPHPNCTPPSYHSSNIQNRNVPVGVWFDVTIQFATLSTTQSMLVVIGAGGSDAPPFQALFDDVYVRER